MSIDVPHEYRFTPCPNLSNLRVHIFRFEQSESTDIIPVVTAQYEQLRYLWINGIKMRPSQRIIWKPVHYHNLSQLELQYLEIEPTGTATFWDLCTQLVSLKIEEVTVDEMPARSITFDRLQRLVLKLKSRNPIERQLEWITQCPNLNCLSWSCSDDGEPTSRFMRPFVPGTWPHLRRLILEGIGFTDVQLARVIGAMQDLKTFSVQTCEVGSRVLEALRHHSQTLTYLGAISCRVLTPSCVPEILISFPHLECLYVQRVKSQDIINGPPWVCERSLKVLRIGISFSLNQDAEHQRQVLQRISRLTNLKKLILDCGRRSKKNLHLRLETVLDQLATLKQLKTLELHPRMEPLSVRDVEVWILLILFMAWQLKLIWAVDMLTFGPRKLIILLSSCVSFNCAIKWMINNWKSLKEVKGYFRQKNMEELVSMFTAAGIKC